MEDLKQLDPAFPQNSDGPKPPVPDKKPLDVNAGDMKPTYSAALKNQRIVNPEPASPSTTSESDAMGFTKVELPASSPDRGSQSKGPRETSEEDSASRSRRSDDDPVPGQELQELRLYRQIDELRQKLKNSTDRAEIAEEKADRMEKRIEEIKNTRVSSYSDVERDVDSLASTLLELKTENSALKEQLRDAQSHIFSLQPYRKELTPDEVGREYDDLVEGITDWVTKFMGPLLDDHAKGVDEILTSARKKPTDALKLKRIIHLYPDLVHGSLYPETDEDIIIAIIMRFLNDNIFQKILYGSVTGYVEALSFVEMALQNHVEPKRDLFAIRTWTAEAYNAILSAREFRGVRERRMQELTIELASIFKILCKKDKVDMFLKNFEVNCIKPAMQLYEKIQVSTHHFYFDINPYIMWGQGGEFHTSPDFVDNLLDLDCKNILQNRKGFNLVKMDPPPSKKELYLRLTNICTVTPALYMRQVGRKDAIKAPQLVRRQQMLVAWGPQEKRDAFVENGDRTLLHHLYSARSERERAEAGGWAPFRWSS